MGNWRGGIKRDKTDIIFSHLIRERANWICEYCLVDFSHNHGALHCSHVYGRRMKGLRWHPLNAFAHCLGCHEKLEQNPLLFASWVRTKLSELEYRKLELMGGKATKITAFEKELIHKHYLKEKKRIHALRMKGGNGRLEFTLP